MEDMLTSSGFCYALSLVLRLNGPVSRLAASRHIESDKCLQRNGTYKAGLLFLAPVCSTWVWVNRPLGLKFLLTSYARKHVKDLPATSRLPRSTSGRTRELPLGYSSRASVAAATIGKRLVHSFLGHGSIVKSTIKVCRFQVLPSPMPFN